MGSQSERSPVPATIPASSGQIRGIQGDVSSTVLASSGAVAAMNEGRFRVDSDSELELRDRIPDLSSDTMSVPPVHGGESDTDTIDGASEVDASEDVVAPSFAEEPIVVEPRSSQMVAPFASLDEVDLTEVFSKRAVVMRSVPRVIRGACRNVMRVALEEVARGLDERSETRMTRGWKLFLLLPRLLLWRPVTGGLVSKKDLELRFRSFQTGQWRELLNTSASTTARSTKDQCGGDVTSEKKLLREE